ncbi:MAG: polysaccharide biosynthesis tyrosine autokinase, partial [Actinomycetota bacterium]
MELKDYIGVMINRRWIVLGTLGIIVAATLIFTFLQSPVYESRVQILSEVSSASESVLGSFFTSALFDPDRYVQTQTEIIKTDIMAQAVESHLQLLYEQRAREREAGEEVFIPERIPNARELASMIKVLPVQRTSIFNILVRSNDPVLSQDIAQAYAEEYIASRQLAAIRQISEARKEVWNRIQEVEDQIREVTEQARQYKAGELPAELQAEAQRGVNLWAALYEKYMTLRIAESLEQRGLEVIQPAQTGIRTSPRPMRNGILAFFLGLILGVGLAFLVDYLDDTLRTREDFEQHYGIPIIGEIPEILPEDLPPHHIIYRERPHHPAAEGFRTLRTNLDFLDLHGERRVILVTSAGPVEGKSTVIVNLGTALAEMGRKVILLEADLRKPVLNAYFDAPADKGLSGVLAGSLPLEEALHETATRGLFILPSGIKPPNPGELSASQSMQDVISRLRSQADYVLIDSPPVLAASDSIALAAICDGVIMVARYGKSNRNNARHAVELLRKVNARLLGLVINEIAPATRYGYYHYYYYQPVIKREEFSGGGRDLPVDP